MGAREATAAAVDVENLTKRYRRADRNAVDGDDGVGGVAGLQTAFFCG